MIREVNTINPFVVPIFEVILGEFNLEEEIEGMHFPEQRDYDTLGGLILDKFIVAICFYSLFYLLRFCRPNYIL